MAFSPLSPPPALRRRIGYVQGIVEQSEIDVQIKQLLAAGCVSIHQERNGVAARKRPILTKLLDQIDRGDMLVVVRLDRVARSITHLLDIIAQLDARGADFRSLQDPVDTSAPQWKISRDVLSAAARLERSVIGERTKSGLKTAKERGRLLGNPGLRERRPEAIRRASEGRRQAYLIELIHSSQDWLPIVERMRPQHNWQDIVTVLNKDGKEWTVERLRRAVHRLVSQDLAKPELIARSPRRPPEDRLMTLVTGLAVANPHLSLRDIASRLDQMGQPTPRGGRKWAASSVKAQLDRARRLGLVVAEPPDSQI